jgi:hypothetical protein
MKNLARMLVIAPSIALLASTLAAQSISIGLRGTGSIPTGSFAETQTGAGNTAVIEGAKTDLATASTSRSAWARSPYGGFDHVKFDCETATCQSDGKYTMSGVRGRREARDAGDVAVPSICQRRCDVPGSRRRLRRLERERADHRTDARLRIGAGSTTSFEILSLTTAVRYIGQNFKPKIPGVITPTTATEQSANYRSISGFRCTLRLARRKEALTRLDSDDVTGRHSTAWLSSRSEAEC